MTAAAFAVMARREIQSGGRRAKRALRKSCRMNDERSASAVSDEETIGESVGALSMAEAGVEAPRNRSPAMPMRPVAEMLSHREKRLIVACMMLPVFLGSVDQSILAAA